MMLLRPSRRGYVVPNQVQVQVQVDLFIKELYLQHSFIGNIPVNKNANLEYINLKKTLHNTNKKLMLTPRSKYKTTYTYLTDL